MEPRIKKLLRENYVDGVINTHVSLVKPKGRYQFNRQTLEEFWEYYCDLISREENPVIGIAEISQQYLPVLADIDLQLKDDGENENEIHALYTEDQLRIIVEIYQSVLRQIVDGCTDDDLLCAVLEKDMYIKVKNDTTYLKHGFHLHFPNCFMNKVDQETQLIPRVKKELEESKIFDTLGIANSGDVIDKNACKVPWLLYGSRKNEENEPYKITKVFNSNQEIIPPVKAFKNYQIFDEKEQLIPVKKNVEYYMPRILSILPYGRTVKEIRKGLISPLKEQIKKREQKSIPLTQQRLSVEESLIIARRLLPMLSDYRTSDNTEWMTVGWILFNISEGSSEGLDLWLEFSARCEEKYDENECINKWEKMTKKDLSLGTLRWFAGIDNPIEYKKFKDEESRKHVKNSIDGSHNDIAKALYAEYGDEFVCASISSKEWYQFCGNKWHQIDDGVFLREKISGEIVKKYYEIGRSIWEELKDCQDKSKEQMLQAKLKQVNKMIGNLKSATYKNNVMREAMEVFYDAKFKERLDADPSVFAFMNGVYDFRIDNGKGGFRKGRPEDYVSKCAPISYIEYSGEEEIVQDIHTFLEQIFPDKSLRKYFLDIYSEVFIGGNNEKIVVFWLGEGDNGKTIMQTIFEKMLGPLAVKLNTNVITGKKPGAGNAFADLARTGGGVRWLVLEEPDGAESINPGPFKLMSGGDSFFARDLYQSGKGTKEICPMFKMTFICNKLPPIKMADKATWNRTRVLLYESTFYKNSECVPDTYEEQLVQKKFPADKNFRTKIPSMLSAFAWVLLEHRKTVTVRVEPDKVIAATEVYKKQNDIYRQFVEDCIINDKNKSIALIELYNIFREWFRDSLPGHTVPVKNDVEEYFIKLWGMPSIGKKWKGYRQRTLQDDVANGDVIILEQEDMMDYSAADIL